MKRIAIKIWTLVLVTTIISCSETELQTFGNEAFINFKENALQGQSFPNKTFTMVFLGDDQTEFSFQIPVTINGRFTGADRTFSISVVDTLTTAVEGTHYTIDPAQQIVETDMVDGMVTINLLRASDLKNTEVSLGITLVDDANFEAGTNAVFVLNFSDFFTEPSWWHKNYSIDYPHIGPFTIEKASFFFEFYNITDGSDPWGVPPYFPQECLEADAPSGCTDDHPVLGPYNSGINRNICSAEVASFRQFILQKEIAQGSPILDENGDRVFETFDF
ncbi:MAG: DUF4843 domain-containing protein [Ekhidna sp.]|nr:DUF4843 domain-containing protein [Ekhidna sp.]MBC6409877.1 DUF4843 domain-containing protein [Ekhidna sp.]